MSSQLSFSSSYSFIAKAGLEALHLEDRCVGTPVVARYPTCAGLGHVRLSWVGATGTDHELAEVGLFVTCRDSQSCDSCDALRTGLLGGREGELNGSL
jgi:hypothetical protein